MVQDRIPQADVSLYTYFQLFSSFLYIAFCMFLSLVSNRAVDAFEVVFSLILLPVLVLSTFKYLCIWYLNNVIWETVLDYKLDKLVSTLAS